VLDVRLQTDALRLQRAEAVGLAEVAGPVVIVRLEVVALVWRALEQWIGSV